eukprot:TRINITY_DN22174_c0_g1_i1.p1 TRINITY_DN22174_c0_g1~~TRINITY_DN22174_c0_g1_i1.p1  ORF type:complete len:443 (+),score=192.60 TRINITY_DN22174_c0_g1_i1:61-1389(+)
MEEKVRLRRRDVEKGCDLVKRRAEDLKLLESQNERLVERLCKGKKDFNIRGEQGKVAALRPEEFSDMFFYLTNRLKLQEMRNNVIDREKVDTNLMIQRENHHLQALECLHIQIGAATGFSQAIDDSIGGIGLSHMEQEVAVKELVFLICVLKKEMNARKTLVAWKDATITLFQREFKDQLAAIEKQAALVNDINVMERQILKVAAEVEEVEKRAITVDRHLEVGQMVKRSKDSSRFLANDCQYLRQRALEANRQREEKEQQAKLQAKKLAEREKQLHVVEQALEDLKLRKQIDRRLQNALIEVPPSSSPKDYVETEDERVPAVLYELLARDVEAMDDSAKLKDVLLLEKDASIDATERKLEDSAQRLWRKIGNREAENEHVAQDLAHLDAQIRKDRSRFAASINKMNIRKKKKAVNCAKLIAKVKARYEEIHPTPRQAPFKA